VTPDRLKLLQASTNASLFTPWPRRAETTIKASLAINGESSVTKTMANELVRVNLVFTEDMGL
jgi:hypothetical protein